MASSAEYYFLQRVQLPESRTPAVVMHGLHRAIKGIDLE